VGKQGKEGDKSTPRQRNEVITEKEAQEKINKEIRRVRRKCSHKEINKSCGSRE
jgi:hypothetical protein